MLLSHLMKGIFTVGLIVVVTDCVSGDNTSRTIAAESHQEDLREQKQQKKKSSSTQQSKETLAKMVSSPYTISPTFLLLQKPIQKELKLTDSQIQQATKNAYNHIHEVDSLYKDLRSLPRAERRKKSLERFTAFRQILEKYEKRAVELLTPSQEKRLHEISLQRFGMTAFISDTIHMKLSISQKQKNQLRQMWETFSSKRRQLTSKENLQNNPDSIPFSEILRRNEAIFIKKALEILTEAQRKKYEMMTGKPFQAGTDDIPDREKAE